MHEPHSPTSPAPRAVVEPSNGGRLVTTAGRALPLLGSVLSADAEGGVARVTLTQRFRNPHDEPLAVTYSLPLPSDGAVSGFAFTIGERRVVGEIDRQQEARERYEQALVEGKSAALLEQDRSSLFTQEIGNIPSGAKVVVELAIDQRLRWLDEGAWEWRFPTVVAPRYLGEPGTVPDADRITQEVADGPLPARFVLGCTVRDRIADGRRPESPTHAVDVAEMDGGTRIDLRESAGARLDRDVVVRWQVAAPGVGMALASCRPEAKRPTSRCAYGLLTVVPPSVESRHQPVVRDLIVLLDTSASMGGEPLAQAVRVVSAIVDTLRDQDQIDLIEFGSAARRWKAHPVSATEGARRDAVAWLRNLHAAGGTKMRHAIVETLADARAGAQRQIVLVTDGQIGFESEVVAAVCDRLPPSARLHTVGVGSAVNRSLTGAAARAGRGVEVVIGLGEDPERAAARIVARTVAPLLVDLVIEGSALEEHVPSRLPDLFAGAPALIGVALRPEGGELVVRGCTAEGAWEQRLRVAPTLEGTGNAAVAALFGREKVEDLEMRLAAGGDVRRIDRAVEGLGIDFQISTRLTSWVAVSERETVDPSDPLRRERMPHELPFGMSAEGLGLRRPLSLNRRLALAKEPPEGMRGGGSGGGSGLFVSPPRSGAGPRPSASRPGKSGRAAWSSRRSAKFDDDVDDDFDMEEPSEATGRAPEVEQRREAPTAVKVAEEGTSSGEASPEAPVEQADGPPAGAERVLRGRVALQRRTLIVIEIVAEGGALSWDAPEEANVALRTGDVFLAKIDAARTTRRGRVAPGATARLALLIEPAASLGPILSVTLHVGGGIVRIEV